MTDTETLAAVVERLEAQEARIAALEEENREFQARPEPPSVGPAGAPSMATTNGAAVDRRSALKKGLGLAGAAAAGAVLLDAAPAAADDGDPLIIGSVDNSAVSGTELYHPGAASYGFTVSSPNTAFAALRAIGSLGGGGLSVFGGRYHVRFVRSDGRIPPVQDTVAHRRGDVVMDLYSTLWYCMEDGTPGRWRVLSGNSTAGSFHLLPTPVRVYDSRPGTSPAQGPKTPLPAGNVARTIDLKLNNSGVPVGATGALVTVLLVNAASGAGNFTMWANDKPKPLSNTMVWGGSAGRFTTVATTALSPQALVKVDASLPTNLVLDVVGYYR